MAKEKAKKAKVEKVSKAASPKKKEVKKKPAHVEKTEAPVKIPQAAPTPAEGIAEHVKAPEAKPVKEVKPAPAREHREAPKPKAKPEVQYAATGRRKTAIARVILVPGSGKILINQKPLLNYIAGRGVLEIMVKKPLVITDMLGKYDVLAKTHGGGIAGQAGAVALGISRALLQVSPELRAKLKPAGFLTRDPRMKERKKYGRKKARKRFQYSKR